MAAASSSTSRPTSRTADADSIAAKVTAFGVSAKTPLPATCVARKSASSAECERDRKSMSFVSRHTRANFA
jgi:hypothetical protein